MKNLITKCLITLLFISMFLTFNVNFNVQASNEKQTNSTLEEFLNTDEKIMMYDARTNETKEVNMEEVKANLNKRNTVKSNNFDSLPSYKMSENSSFLRPSLDVSIQSTAGPVERVIDTTVARYRATCRVSANDTKSQRSIYGTASLVGPNLALTAAHCVFNKDDGNKAYPGWCLFPAYNGSAYEGASACGWAQVYYYDSWMQKHDTEHDVVVCTLTENVGNEVGYYGIRKYDSNSGLNGINVNLLGYPADTSFGFTSNGIYQYCATGQITSVNNYNFNHNCFNVPGFSGGPIVPISNVTQIVGINVATTVLGKNGVGVKITDHLYNLINSLR